MKRPLFQNQISSLNFFKNKPRGIDNSDPGTGKTRVQLELLLDRLDEGKALVVAPKKILKVGWGHDIEKFTPHLRYAIALAGNREKAFDLDADVFIINTDGVTWIAHHMFGNKRKGIKPKNPRLLDKFSTLIVDEITAFKHHTSARSKALAKIKDYFKYRYGLTGTPNSNHITDVWHQVFVVDDGKRLGKSFYAFRSTTCVPKQVGPDPRMQKWEPIEGIESAVAQLISDITIRHKFEDCQDIPENFITEVDFDPSDKLLKAFEKMRKTAELAISVDQHISAVNAAALMNKLMQISAGVAYDESRSSAILDTERYEILMDLLAQRDQCLIFFNWHHQRDLIEKYLKQKKYTYGVIDGIVTSKESDKVVQRFQAGLIKHILAHPMAAAHGLTLTRGTSTIWTSPTFNLEHYIQGNRRIYRAGQTKRTETVMLLANKTMDHAVYDKLKNKNKRQLNLLSLLEDL